MKATFQSLAISLLLGLTLVNASPIPQDVPPTPQDIAAKICSIIPAEIASTIPQCASAAQSPAPAAPQKRQGLPDVTDLCSQVAKTVTPLSAVCSQAFPKPKAPADGRRRQLPTPPSEVCQTLPAPVASLVGCAPATPAPAAAARQLDAVTGLLGELSGLPVSAPAQPAAPAAAARQLDGLTSVIGSLSGELVPTTAPPKGAAAAKRQVPPAVGSLLSGITSAVSGAGVPKIPGLPAIPPATSTPPATSAPEARQLDLVTGLLGGVVGLVPGSPSPQGAAAAKRQEAPSPAQVVSEVCDPSGPLASFSPIAAICSTAASDPEAAIPQLCQLVPLSICPAPDAEPAPPSTPAPDAAAEA